MSPLITTIIVGISLSMDAFSLSLIYGTMGINHKEKIKISLIVGAYHFLMPLLGLQIGTVIINHLFFKLEILVALIFIIIGLELVITNIKNKEITKLKNMVSYLVFGLSVSIDSFTTGIGLTIINNNYIEVCSIFCLISALFTYLGLNVGNILNIKYGKLSTIIGGIILTILGISYLF